MTILLRALLVLVMGLVLVACPAPNQGRNPSPAETAEETEEADDTDEPEETEDEGGGGGEGDEVSVFTLSVGDCMNFVDEDDNTVEDVDCEEEHEYEVYEVLEAGDEEDEYPDEDELLGTAIECRADPFEEYVGAEYAVSQWYSLEIIPTEDEWEDGARVIPCLLYLLNEDTSTGSAEGSENGGGEDPEETEDESGGGGDFPNEDEERLLAHIPEEFRDECGETDFAVTGIATVGCGIEAAGGDISITYNLFESEDEMYEAYDRNLEFLSIERDLGPCGDEWPGETTYDIGDVETGRVACAEFGSALIIAWTDEEFLIKGYAEGFGVDQAEFHDWWATESGPIPAEGE